MLIRQMAETIQRHRMICAGDRILVAISGGPDSVALTQALFDLRHKKSLAPFELTLAHLNHNLRKESDRDEAFCCGFAAELGLAFVSGRSDVRSEARRSRRSLEEAGRLARYRFLESTALQRGCTRIAVGHTRNDQAETFLLRMIQGAGTTGLGAMHPVSRGGRLIRPLLAVKRQDVMEFLTSRGLRYQTDRTNLDCSIPRNRVRHRALPFLENQFNPSLIDTLARTTDLLRDEEAWMNGEARRALEQMAGPEEDEGVKLPVGRLAELPPALARRVIRLAVTGVKGDLRAWSACHVNQVLHLTAPGKSGRQLSLPGIECFRSFDDLWIRPASGTGAERKGRVNSEQSAQGGYNGYEYELPVPGRLEIPEAGGVIETEESRPAPLPAAVGSSVVVGLPGGTGGDAGLSVRNPRPGDRFRALGAPGTKPLSRYLMEHRVEWPRRRRIPLLVHGEREVLWVVGHGVSELSRVGPGTDRRLHLTWVEG